MMKIMLAILIACMMVFVFAGCGQPAGNSVSEHAPAEPAPEAEPEQELIDDFITLATTTSTYDSGLLAYLHPFFTKKTGLEVRVVSQGTGAALQMGSRGDADLLLVHDRAAELKLVEEGAYVDRHDAMYNDFVIVGPEDDPAGVMDEHSVVDAFNLLAAGGFTFVSRGDDSGTHRMEERLWESAGTDPAEQGWYLSIGQGMGNTLIMTNEKLGYSMTDRGTYAAMQDNLDLVIVLEGDPVLFNQYGVMAVNPDEHPHVKYDYARMYIDFIMSDQGQDLISSYEVNGETLFFPGYGLE